MGYHLSRIFFILSLLIPNYWVRAQPSFSPLEVQLEKVEIPGGDFANMGSNISQDSFGFIWIASRAGLHRYDGKDFRTYSFSEKATPEYIEKLIIDKQGNYWAASYGNGLFKFDPFSGEYAHFLYEADVTSNSPNFITNMIISPDDKIWISTINGILIFDTENASFEHLTKIKIEDTHYPLGRIETILIDKEDNIWLALGNSWVKNDPNALNGLVRYTSKNNSFKFFQFQSEETSNEDPPIIASIYEDKQGYLWVGTNQRGLYRFDPNIGMYHQFDLPVQFPISSNYVQIISGITEDCYGRIWIAMTFGGFYCFDPHTGATQRFLLDPYRPNNQSVNNTWRIMTDQDGAIWLDGGTSNPGIYKFFPCPSPRGTENIPTFSTDDLITAFSSSNEHSYWIGTKSNGLVQQSSGKHELTSFPKIEIKDIKAIEQDEKGNLWVGCWPTPCGLIQIAPNGKEVRTFKKDLVNSKGLSNELIMDIVEDQKGNIWVATWGGGLNRYDPIADRFFHYQHSPQDSTSIGGDYLTSLYEDDQGQLWIGGGGAMIEMGQAAFIDQFNPETQSFEHYYNNFEVPVFSEIDAITDITGHPEHGIWVSKKGVIAKLAPKTGTVKTFAPSEANKHYNWYWNIQIDSTGGIWSTSEDGLVYLNPMNEHFTLFPWHQLPIDAHWWQPLQFNGNDILVGGKGGYIKSNRYQLLENVATELPDIILTEFKIQGESINPERGKVWEIKQIKLGPNQNIFSLNIAAPYFSKDEPIIIEYKLEDYDLGWTSLEENKDIAYFKVPPGHYTFLTRARNLSGQIKDSSQQISLVILAPWWQRWWAFLLYISTILIFAYFLYRFLLRRQLLETEAARLRELDDLKNRLYTNITHEFRTPLTVIGGITEEIVGHKKEKELIRQNSAYLLGLVNQILSLQKLESKQIPLQLTQGDLASYLNYLVESFQSLAQRRSIQLSFYTDPLEIPMLFDEEKIQQLITNLIANAIKFTREGGKIQVGLSLVQDESKVKIKIRDTGIGIPTDQLDSIFDRFHQVNHPKQHTGEGTGIGLAVVKELILLMDGTIQVESELNKGTSFTMVIPKKTSKIGPDATNNNQTEYYSKFIPSTVPLSKEVLQKKPPAIKHPIELRKNYILIVEDNQDVAYYLQVILQEYYRLEIVTNGIQGYKKAAQEIPDLIISDVMMPEMDGYALCAKLKEDERTNHIPIILLTAKSDQEDKLKGLKKGADAYLSKPFDKRELFIRIEKLLELRRKMQFKHFQKKGQEGPDYEDQFLQKLHKIVHQHLSDEHFGTPQLCRAMAMSRTQLHRKLKALLDIPTARFIQLTRLHRARQLILTTEKTISEISYETGFKDPSYFTKLYFAEFNEKPSETRK